MSRSRIPVLFGLLVAAGALLLAQVAHAQFQIAPLQQLPMPPPAVRPTKLAHFGEFAFTDGQTILVTVDEGNAAYTYVLDKRFDGFSSSGNLLGINPIADGDLVLAARPYAFRDSSIMVFARTGGVWAFEASLILRATSEGQQDQ